jgi:hypothetical protein
VWSPESPWVLIKVINVLGAQGWYVRQLERMADGQAPDEGPGVLGGFVRYMAHELAQAARLRR